ncbi:MAG: UPF0149 family protein [Gammaproteobacteria bacterium]|nr:UPF0149 family protein [Gammaproteobacteria bacterium]MCF6230147.1 UPF0149 family protein [Gammaproteobacteria bacterium]
MANKTEILFTLGDLNCAAHQWPDYLQYGFNNSDVTALLKIAGDKALHQADADSANIWAPLHAWRTLAQLRCSHAALPLIKLFDELVEDDWALYELPIVLGMIGESAIEPLAALLNTPELDEFTHVMAVDALCEVVEHYPEQRRAVLAHYQAYLEKPDLTLPTLNGLLIGRLCELKAKELIEGIRALYQNDGVDSSCAGDLEEVEIKLGFRSSRETPRPSQAESYGFKAAPAKKPESGDVIDLVNYYFDRDGNDEAIFNASELDGFFSALACAPNNIMAAQWLPALWGGEEKTPHWKKRSEYEEFNDAIFTFYNHVMEGMHKKEYHALFLVEVEDEQEYTIVSSWCEGFMRGITLWDELTAAEDHSALEQALKPIQLFTTQHEGEALDQLSEEQINQSGLTIEPAVKTLYLHFLEQRQRANKPIQRTVPKVGRNNPCPCGSGKKYKKCCG